MSTVTADRASARAWWGLAILLIPALLVSMDISVLFVAAPAITEALQPSATQWVWMMDIYGFVMAGLLVTMGSLGDRYGRRTVLLLGAALFGIASLTIATADTVELLIVARALLGIGAATLAPSTLSLIRGMFIDQRQRRTAIGAWTVAFTGGAVAGPIIGGVLLEYFWWGSVFLINVPVMVLLVVAGPFVIAESKNPDGAAFDILGAATSLIAVLSLVYAVKHITQEGIDAVAGVGLSVGVVSAALFVRRQRRARHPLIEIDLFTRPMFSAAVGSVTAASFAAAGLGLLAFTLMQTVYGLTALQAALWATPTFAGTFAGAVVAGVMAGRARPGRVLPVGLLIAALGFAGVAASDGLIWFIAGYVVVTFGVGIIGTVANELVLSTAPPHRAGAASGISETSTELGSALGIAGLGTIGTTVFVTAGTGTQTVTEAVAAARELPGAEATGLLERAFDAYGTGVSVAAGIGAAVLLVTALLTALALRDRRPRRSRPLTRVDALDTGQ